MSDDFDDFKEKLDQNADGYTYSGKAAPGQGTSEPVWQIARFNASGNPFTYEWADGDNKFDNVWDNRTSLSYS